MQQQIRVLARMQARELTEKELEKVSGGIRTATKCTVFGATFADGDPGEC